MEIFLDLEGWQDSGRVKGGGHEGSLIEDTRQCLACRRCSVDIGCTA